MENTPGISNRWDLIEEWMTPGGKRETTEGSPRRQLPHLSWRNKKKMQAALEKMLRSLEKGSSHGGRPLKRRRKVQSIPDQGKPKLPSLLPRPFSLAPPVGCIDKRSLPEQRWVWSVDIRRGELVSPRSQELEGPRSQNGGQNPRKMSATRGKRS